MWWGEAAEMKNPARKLGGVVRLRVMGDRLTG